MTETNSHDSGAADTGQTDTGQTDTGQTDTGQTETRRERQRRETVDEIKAAAGRHLTLETSSQLSLRAVARDVGLTPSAIYRYFASQQELMAAVARDAFASVSDFLAGSARETAGRGIGERLLGFARAYRQWAGSHRAEFNLLFNSNAVVLSTDQDERRVLAGIFAVPLTVVADAEARGELDPTRSPIRDVPDLPEDVRQILQGDLGVTAGALDLLIALWACVHGLVTLELFGPLGLVYDDPAATFERHVRSLLATSGLLEPATAV